MSNTPLYGPRVAATGVLLLGLGAVLAIAMLRSTLGPFHFRIAADTAPTWEIALWTTGSDRERARSAERWHERLEERVDLERVDRDELVRLADGQIDLLIVDGVALGDKDAARLRPFVSQGGRLALFGAREANRDAVPGALSALVGEPIRAASDYRWTLLPGTPGPLSAGFSATDRLPLRRAHDVYALPARDAEVVWAAANHAGAGQGAARHTRIGDGRLVWWSVRPDVALDRVDTQATMTRMVRASVAWLLEEPFAEIEVADDVDPASFEKIDVRLTRRSATRFLLSLTNRGAAESPTLGLRVHLNRHVSHASLELTSVSLRPGGLELPVIQLVARGTEASFQSSPIGPGASRSYYLDLEETETPQ